MRKSGIGEEVRAVMGGQFLKELVGHPKALAFTGKPLESFEWRSHMIGLIFLKHHSDVLRINSKEAEWQTGNRRLS